MKQCPNPKNTVDQNNSTARASPQVAAASRSGYWRMETGGERYRSATLVNAGLKLKRTRKAFLRSKTPIHGRLRITRRLREKGVI